MSQNRIVIGLPERYESAKRELRRLENLVESAIIVVDRLPDDENKEKLLSILRDKNDDTIGSIDN